MSKFMTKDETKIRTNLFHQCSPVWHTAGSHVKHPSQTLIKPQLASTNQQVVLLIC